MQQRAFATGFLNVTRNCYENPWTWWPNKKAGTKFSLHRFSCSVRFSCSGLHDELQLLPKAGLTPIEALQSATTSPAEFLRTAKVSGTVEKGKHADLVLLDANPLDDIRNTRKIHAVVLRGKLLDRVTLDALLKDENGCRPHSGERVGLLLR